ncbi:hypothetical protein T484DRAFT_1951257 [Baffinella frigidus]|nr:hypothetical protein T484DRAFT_1951257 [Cryptophyta sp. CCMP2293]
MDLAEHFHRRNLRRFVDEGDSRVAFCRLTEQRERRILRKETEGCHGDGEVLVLLEIRLLVPHGAAVFAVRGHCEGMPGSKDGLQQAGLPVFLVCQEEAVANHLGPAVAVRALHLCHVHHLIVRPGHLEVTPRPHLDPRLPREAHELDPRGRKGEECRHVRCARLDAPRHRGHVRYPRHSIILRGGGLPPYPGASPSLRRTR